LGVVFAVVAALIQEKWAGAAEILTAIQVFADALSYLRLYALGMASMIMAVTFNQLGEMVGLTLGIFIIIIGHAVNIAVGLMGGVIHGLRLNFLEWYHYSFEGGGKAFNPLKIIKLGD
jgi:V/A-type H+-transporting ATPase subunit I